MPSCVWVVRPLKPPKVNCVIAVPVALRPVFAHT